MSKFFKYQISRYILDTGGDKILFPPFRKDESKSRTRSFNWVIELEALVPL